MSEEEHHITHFGRQWPLLGFMVVLMQLLNMATSLRVCCTACFLGHVVHFCVMATGHALCCRAAIYLLDSCVKQYLNVIPWALHAWLLIQECHQLPNCLSRPCFFSFLVSSEAKSQAQRLSRLAKYGLVH